MLKALSSLWWRSAKRIAKVQQAKNKKLAKSLLAQSRKKMSATPVKTSKPNISVASQKLKKASASSPGRWLSFYYDAIPDDGRTLARRMRYWLYLPNRREDLKLPLVVMLHGCDQTAIQFAQGTRMNQLAEAKGFAVLYPQQSLRSNALRCWPWYEKSIQRGGGEAQMILGIIEKVIEKYPIDEARVYVAGISAGAAMANIVALAHPDKIAAVGLHSSPVYGAGHSRMAAYAVMNQGTLSGPTAIAEAAKKLGSLRKMPAILIHGNLDKVVRPINQAQLVQQFKIINQLSPKDASPAVLKAASRSKKNPTHAYRMQDYIVNKKRLLRVCEILNLEHGWSGGDCTLKYNDCAGPDSSKMMWQFFSGHRRVSARNSKS